MLVVADSSPINILVRIGEIHVLPALFAKVVVPPEVLAELSHPRTPASVRAFAESAPSWFEVGPAREHPQIQGIDVGEQAAIGLAIELSVPLLIDDFDGRAAATRLGVRIVGTLGVLQLADDHGLIELPSVLAAIQQTDFRLAQNLVDAALARRIKRREVRRDG